jgi:D-alanyl-D-alanine carboxypeptidase/D-alanyl-D-alanine-endopeptidase (penicillin-binding protein 4)
MTLPQQNPAEFSAAQWRSAFAAQAEMPLSQRIALWADLAAVGSIYAADPLGEGPGAVPDAGPLLDFRQVDCVTYLEQVYALALSTNRAQVDDTLRRIRYREGRVDYRWRNHFIEVDWLPANAWFIRDITEEVGAEIAVPMTRTIARGKFFRDKGLAKYADLPDETITTSYLPRAQVTQAVGAMKTGDMAIFVIDTPGYVVGHVGLLRVRNGAVYLQHASSTAKTVVTVPLLDYLAQAPARFLGLKIARPCPAP